MKKPLLYPRKRATLAPRRAPRSRTEAAIALVRAEFERERLDREIAQFGRRVEAARFARDAAANTGRALRLLLSERNDGAFAPFAKTMGGRTK